MQRIERLVLGAPAALENFEVEIGAMEYGFEIGGILGMDALRAARVVLNLSDLTLEFVPA